MAEATSVDDVTALVVNFGTPDLTRAAVWSLRSLYPDLPILIVENGSPDDSAVRLEKLAAEAGGITILVPGRNLHHGPGLDLAARTARTPWLLLFDSDCVAFRRGFIERMKAQAEVAGGYMVGQVHHLDEGGFDVPLSTPDATPYVHPKCALVRREVYLTLPPFAKHGAPCLANEREAARRNLPLLHFPVADYVFHLGEGTVRRYGYGLGGRSRWDRLKHLVGRRLHRA